jgi:hypothetical protein
MAGPCPLGLHVMWLNHAARQRVTIPQIVVAAGVQLEHERHESTTQAGKPGHAGVTVTVTACW